MEVIRLKMQYVYVCCLYLCNKNIINIRNNEGTKNIMNSRAQKNIICTQSLIVNWTHDFAAKKK